MVKSLYTDLKQRIIDLHKIQIKIYKIKKNICNHSITDNKILDFVRVMKTGKKYQMDKYMKENYENFSNVFEVLHELFLYRQCNIKINDFINSEKMKWINQKSKREFLELF